MSKIILPTYYQNNTFEELSSISTTLSEPRKEWSRLESISSFEEAKKKPILKASSSFAKRKRNSKTSKRLSFKKQLREVFPVESYKEYNVDMSQLYDFMGFDCPRPRCNGCNLF